MGSTGDTQASTDLPGTVETDFLIVGTGPAGGSLSAFLSRYGLSGVTISAAHGTADTPRAHITNMAALEALRDIGLDDECYKLGKQGAHTKHYRWCETMAGEEYARIYAWGNDPRRKGDYKAASPCPGVLDLPQTLLEPLLVRFATSQGWQIRFDTQLLSFTTDAESGKITATVKDLLTGLQYNIISRYLFGADGGRSPVAKALQLPMDSVPGGGTAFNCLCRVDLSHLMQSQSGNLHWNLRLKRDDPWMINMRMVKPWFEWLAVALPKDPFGTYEPWNKEQWADAIKDLVGDEQAEVEVLNISPWKVNEVVAERYAEGNVFCLGDAVHRHPPVNGLGSNTCIGDAFNLAWKVNLVHKGIAHPSLLDTYNTERQPIGAGVVRTSNFHLRKHVEIWQALGMKPPGHSLEERTVGIRMLKEESDEGRQRRKHFQELVRYMYHETHALGLEMGQKYSGDAVHDLDETESWRPPGREAEDNVLYYEPCTYPGRSLPHVWLGQSVPSKLISTHDIVGKGEFCLLTGPGGQYWRAAAGQVGKDLGLPIKAVGIGAGQEWEDVYFEWALKRGVEEDGAVLVRPDLFVAWRAEKTLGSTSECGKKVREVMNSILGW